MNTDLSSTLNRHVSSLDHALSDSAVETAQRKLETLVTARPASIRRSWIGWAAAAASACLVLALAMLPGSDGVAFAAVQKHLSDFNTLTFAIGQQSQGVALPDIRVRMNREGDVRTDVGSLSSTVISTRDHRMLTLLHDSHQAMQLPLNGVTGQQPGDNLAWLDAIRQFQGNAQRMPGSRLIDGQRTTGWSLETGGMHMVLWADGEGLPRAIEINGGKVFSQHMHVTVDAPIDATVFSTRVPAGYHLMSGDDE